MKLGWTSATKKVLNALDMGCEIIYKIVDVHVVTYHISMLEPNAFLDQHPLIGAGIGEPSSVKQREANLRRGEVEQSQLHANRKATATT